MEITQLFLKEIVIYDQETGFFTWKVSRGGSLAGSKVGCLDKYGYIRINIKRKNYSGHRMAWLFVYGSFPAGDLDHINGIKTDNRIGNLREVSDRQNQQNRKSHRQGRLPGTTFIPKINRWRARITVAGKKISLGCFNSQEEAHDAYLKATRVYP